MHLASRFLVSCLENADESVALIFFQELKSLDLFKNFSVKQEDLDYLLTTDPVEGGGGLQAPRAVFRHARLRRQSADLKRLLALAEAGLRLAALFHDLGHLPFSHDLEFALEDYLSAKARRSEAIAEGLTNLVGGPPHEVIGHSLATLVFQSLVRPETKPAVRAAYAMARKILEVDGNFYFLPKPRAGAVQWLHSLVDGEIDVDRADYLLRDGRALGFEFAAYDIERLIGNLILIGHPILGLTSAVEERGFSALETFYVSRARSNQFLVRHHKVAQIGAAFRFVSAKAFDEPDCAEFLQVLADLGSEKELDETAATKLLIDIGKFDDGWWTQVLKKTSNATPMLRNCLGLVLSRQFTLKSIWKRKGDISPQSLARVNAYLTEMLRGERAASELAQLRQRLEKNNLLVSVHKFSPYKIRESNDGRDESLMLVRLADGQLRPVATHSPLLRSLVTAWDEDIHLHVSALLSEPQTHRRSLVSYCHRVVHPREANFVRADGGPLGRKALLPLSGCGVRRCLLLDKRRKAIHH